MNEHEAANVLGVLNAAWPQVELGQQTADLWIGMLERTDVAVAMAAARTVIRHEHWFPSIARFLQAVETEAQHERTRRASTVGLPTAHHRPVAPPPALLAAARQLLAEQAGKRHWHGGPEPCPVCGGVAPPKLTTTLRRSP